MGCLKQFLFLFFISFIIPGLSFCQCPDDPGEFPGTCSPSPNDGSTICMGTTISAEAIGCTLYSMPSNFDCCPPNGDSKVYYLIYRCGDIPNANFHLNDPLLIGISDDVSMISADAAGLDAGISTVFPSAMSSPFLTVSDPPCLSFVPYLNCADYFRICLLVAGGIPVATCEPVDIVATTSIFFTAPLTCDDGDCNNGIEYWDNATCTCQTGPPAGTFGCTNPAFCEYNPAANCDDGSCSTLCCPTDYTGMNSLSGLENGTGGAYGNGDFETEGQINSSQEIVSGIVDYDSGTTICLDNGFEIKLGAILHAFIDGCNGSGGEIDP